MLRLTARTPRLLLKLESPDVRSDEFEMAIVLCDSVLRCATIEERDCSKSFRN